jgi:ABC-type glycerol-3-phosphate transport system substrate-binding protein
MLKRLLLLCAAVLLAACAGDPTGSDTPFAVSVQPDGDAALLLTNTDDQPVYFRIFNPDAFALWAPCTSPADCPEIAPGQTVRVTYAEIGLYAPESLEAELHWWQFRRAGDGYVEAGTGSSRIQLRR